MRTKRLVVKCEFAKGCNSNLGDLFDFDILEGCVLNGLNSMIQYFTEKCSQCERFRENEKII